MYLLIRYLQYSIVTDESTAVNYSQGDLGVIYSRGYKRQSLAVDSGFESYTCDDHHLNRYQPQKPLYSLMLSRTERL